MNIRTLARPLGTMALLGAAALLATVAHGAPSKSQILTECKAEVRLAFGDKARTKLKRFSGAKAHLRITHTGAAARTLICRVDREAGVTLSYRDGSPIQYISQSN